MKKYLALLALAVTCVTGYSQSTNIVWQTNIVTVTQQGTNAPFLSGPLVDVFRFVSSGTNWVIAPYGIVAKSDAKYTVGGGIALAYHLSDFVMPMMRLDYMDHKLYMPSANLQLQAPVTLFGKVTTIPFAFAGIATPISGTGNNNGTVVGIFGAGLALRLDFLGSGKFWQKSDLVWDVETWNGAAFHNQQQMRFGWAFKF